MDKAKRLQSKDIFPSRIVWLVLACLWMWGTTEIVYAIDAPFNVRHKFQKIKGIQWEHATEKTQQRFLHDYKKYNGQFPQEQPKKQRHKPAQQVSKKELNAEVDAAVPFHVRYLYEKQKGISWYNATKKTREKFLNELAGKKNQADLANSMRAQYQQQQEANRQQAEAFARMIELDRENTRAYRKSSEKLYKEEKRQRLKRAMDNMKDNWRVKRQSR